MSINDKLNHIKETKGLIKDAIMNKGVLVTEKDSFRSYADKIMDIPQEGGGDPYYEDLYNLKTSNGTNMSGLFARTSVDSLDLRDLDMSKATKTSYMFNYTTANELDMSGWDTSKVTDMSYMFSYANIKNMNMDGWDTSKVTNMSYMYDNFTGQPIELSFDMSKVTNASYMFNYCKAPIIDLANWDGSSLTNISNLFSSCTSKLLNIQNLKFPKITSIERIFYQYNAKELDLSEFDISNITSMSYLFGFSNLVKINLTNWNTSKVTNMGNMFYYMTYLEELIIPDWDMTNVTNSSSFMYNVSKLRYIDLSRSNDATIRKILSFLPTKKATEIGEILIPENTSQDIIDSLIAKYWKPIGPNLQLTSFEIASELDEILLNGKTKIHIGNYEPWYAGKVGIEFVSSDDSIVTINEEGEATAVSLGNVEIYARLKDNHNVVSNSITIAVSETDSYPNVIKFRGTSTPNTVNYIKVNGATVQLTAMSYNSITGIYTYDVGRPITAVQFNGSGNPGYENTLTELIKLNTSNITSMDKMFYLTRITSLDVSNWDTSNVTRMYSMFQDCSSLTSLDLSNWDTSNVTDMERMFDDCFSLTSLDVSKWDTSKVFNMSSVFTSCSSLTSLDLSNWDTNRVTNTVNMFRHIPSSCQIYVDKRKWTLTELETSFSGKFIDATPDWHTEYYTEYTIDTSVTTFSSTDTIQDGAYLPQLSNGYTYIELTLNDRTETTDLSTEASLVSSIRIYYPEETSYIKFANTKVKEVTHLNGTNITDCRGMFTNCVYLESADLSTLDSSKVVVDETMFEGVNAKCKVEVNDEWDITEEDMGWEGYYNPYFVEYTIAVEEGSTDTLKFKNTNDQLKYIPNMISGYNDITDSIIIKLKDGNTTDSLDTLASDVESIRIYYPENIKRITFGETLSAKAYGLKEILYINIDSITSTYNMFAGCSSLTSLDVSNWDTSNVTEMSGMFDGCSSLTSLDVSNWDTSNVEEMRAMFACCRSLITIDLSNWDTSKVTNMSSMFDGCSSLTSLDVSNWDVSNVTDMMSMFAYCTSLTSLNVSNWDVSNVTRLYYVFTGCSSLTTIGDVSNWDTRNVTDMRFLFASCSSLTSLDLSNWDVSNVTDMRETFKNCSSLTSLDLSNWDVSNKNVDYISDMLLNVPDNVDFHYDGNNYANWTFSEYETAFQGVFPWNAPYYIEYTIDVEEGSNDRIEYDDGYIPILYRGSEKFTPVIKITLKDGTITNNLNTLATDVERIKIGYDKTVTSIQFCKEGVEKFYIKELLHAETSCLTSMYSMFYKCKSLTSLDVSNWDTSKVTNMNSMFDGCSSLTSLDVSKWDVSNVDKMHNMFRYCRSLTSLDLSNWNVSNVSNVGVTYMFSECRSLTSLNLSNWDTRNITTMNNMLSYIPTDVDWHYDGTNYTNWTLTESQTSYSGTFPWNQ